MSNAALFALRPETLKKLLEGDFGLWAILIGTVAGLLLGFLASKTKELQRKKTTDPDEIIAEFKKWSNRSWSVVLLPAPLIVIIVFTGMGMVSPIVVGIVFFVGFFAATLIGCASWKCPGCGASLGQDWSPKHCSKCGVRLK